MDIYNQKLWSVLEEKTAAADADQPKADQIKDAYLAAVREICVDAVELAKSIRDVFPLYTLHDETHICNVMKKMAELLGDDIEKLSRDEAAMLVLAACCHDIGMSYSTAQIRELMERGDEMEQYLEDHPDAYVRIKSSDNSTELPEDLLLDFLRSFHHEHTKEILQKMDWPQVLDGRVDCDNLIRICQSHGQSANVIRDFEWDGGVDLKMCAILLRLADILDFDTSRAPQAVYHYSGFDNRVDSAAKISKEEWEKHKSSRGFPFNKVKGRKYPYDLPYDAICSSMQIEQTINSYIDWVDSELSACQSLLRYCEEKWQKLVLPMRIARSIKPKGYKSGQFRLTLDQDRVLDLLVGESLYQDPAVFVRELLQNAIDAVRTREKIDRNLPRSWKPQINIRCWMDAEGYHWFRIEDNGIGMDRKIIENYFLKVGRSYYTSSDFEKEKLRNDAADYTPISRFGIGILSCFMGDKRTNQVEISTKRYTPRSQAIRMSMHGVNGYYYLATKDECPNPPAMKGVDAREQRGYRTEPGTAIAVRTNLYQSGKYHSFREILDQYVAYPVVPVHYEDENGSYDYPTEQELMEAMHAIAPSEDPEKRGVLEFELTSEQIKEIETRYPGLRILESPRVVFKCDCLDQSSESGCMSGAALMAKLEGGKASCRMTFGTESVKPNVVFSLQYTNDQLRLRTALEFPGNFETTLRRQPAFQLEKELRSLKEARGFDSVTTQILRGLDIGRDTEEDWHTWLQDRFKLSAEELQAKIQSLRTRHQEALDAERITDQIEAAYRNSRKSHFTVVWNLNDAPWYKRFWKSSTPGEDIIRLAAHNGVRCGNGEFFVGKPFNSPDLGAAILLLKDGYRPELDVARARVLRLPLAAAVEIEILHREWQHQGFKVSKKEFEDAAYWRIPSRVYLRLMEKRPDLVKRLRIETDQGIIGVDAIAELLERDSYLELREPSWISHSMGYVLGEPCKRYFAMAYLRKEYALMGNIGWRGEEILILPKSQCTVQEGWEDFPPAFFLPVDGDAEWIADRSILSRHFCNEAHPLSKFLMANRAELERRTPGLFWEIMTSLSEEREEEAIPRINECLRRIRDLPGSKLEVSEDCFLKKSDFI